MQLLFSIVLDCLSAFAGLNEMFTWGINANCTLGHENVQRKFIGPECVSFFSKQGIAVKQVTQIFILCLAEKLLGSWSKQKKMASVWLTRHFF